jgi:hypothetical protein
VRGDSLRDLYAKTLAVIGLGLLAGAGAVVDYWPVGSAMPVVNSPRLPASAAPQLSQRFDIHVPAPAVRRAVAEPVIVRSGPVGIAALRRTSFVQAPAAPASTVPETIEVAAPVPELNLAPDSSWQLLVPASSVALADLAPPPMPSIESPGMISGALRKTKDSIIRTGMVTGGSIKDAFKGVWGAFKKVSPF